MDNNLEQLHDMNPILYSNVMNMILDHYFGNIMIVNNKGYIVFVNKNLAEAVYTTKENLLGMHVKTMRETGLSDISISEMVMKTEKSFAAPVTTSKGDKLFTLGTPIFDTSGSIIYVVNFSLGESMLKIFNDMVDKERNIANRYKRAWTFLESGHFRDIIAESEAMKTILFLANQVAKTDSTILLLGESGTGKEVMARYIHENSTRAQELFLPVNCAALPKELIESEFFGYSRGAFTGANKEGKAGLLQLADKGTLFLDEIGELPLSVQSKLLRALESKEFTRIGSSKSTKTNFRLLAATNKNLADMVINGQFREDLYYRLNVVPLVLLPLRERKEDIKHLAFRFLDEYNQKYDRAVTITEHQLERFYSYSWPGNIRELRNIIERMVVTSGNSLFDFTMNTIPSNFEVQGTGSEMKLRDAVRLYESEMIARTIKLCNGNVSLAARKLGIHRTEVYKKFYKKTDKNV